MLLMTVLNKVDVDVRAVVDVHIEDDVVDLL